MDKRDQRLDVSGLGAELVVRPTGSVCDEGDLAFDVIGRPRGFLTHRHVHIGQVERYEVIAGETRVELDGRSYLLRAGPGRGLTLFASRCSARYQRCGDQLIVLVHAHGLLRSTGEEAGYGAAHAWTLRDGTPVRFHEYVDAPVKLGAVQAAAR